MARYRIRSVQGPAPGGLQLELAVLQQGIERQIGLGGAVEKLLPTDLQPLHLGGFHTVAEEGHHGVEQRAAALAAGDVQVFEQVFKGNVRVGKSGATIVWRCDEAGCESSSPAAPEAAVG